MVNAPKHRRISECHYAKIKCENANFLIVHKKKRISCVNCRDIYVIILHASLRLYAVRPKIESN